MAGDKCGAPTLFTQEIWLDILDRIAAGEPLEWISRDAGMPKPRTVRDWVGKSPELEKQYREARRDGADAIAADILTIADTPIEADMVEYTRMEKPRTLDADGVASGPVEYEEVVTKRTRKDALEHRKLRIDTRLKLLAKWDPRYAERLAVEHDLSSNLAETLKDARERASQS